MTTSPEHTSAPFSAYPFFQRADGRIKRWIVAVVLVTALGTSASAVMTPFVLAKLTAQGQTLVGQGHTIVRLERVQKREAVEHTDELTKIEGLYQQLGPDVKAVASYAANLLTELNDNHDISRANQQAICAAIPGCVLPPGTS